MSKKISELDAITFLAADDILTLVRSSDLSNKKITPTNFFGNIPVDVGIGVTPEAALHVLSLTDNIVIPHITALFQNTGEVVAGSDYQNEVHVRLQAGTTAEHRRYINFAGFDGADDWITGVNGSNNWILYDTISPGHRFQFTTGAAADTNIMSSGTGVVKINAALGGEASGSGGLAIYDGAAAPQLLHAFAAEYRHYKAGVVTGTLINSDGQLALLGAINTNYTQTVRGTYTQTAGVSSGGINVQSLYQPSAVSTSGHIGLSVIPVASGVNNHSGISGASFNPADNSTGVVPVIIGAQYFVDINGPAIANAYGQLSTIRNLGASTVDNAHGIYIASAINSGGGAITVNYGMRILDQAVGGTNIGIRSGVTSGANKYNLYLDGTAVNYIVGRTGFNILAPLAQVHIDQSDNAAAIPTMILDQADISEGFINFIGSDRGVITGVTNSTASVRVELGGVVYRLALYADA